MTNDITRPFKALSVKTNDLLFSFIVAIVLTGASYGIGVAAGWIGSVNYLEAFAVFTSYSCTYLCVRERRINYPIGALSTAAYCVLFFESGLLSSAILNAYLTPSLLYGWIRWRKDEVTKPISWGKARWYPVYILVSAAAYVGVFYITTAFGARLAILDTFILVGSILAQLLLDNKIISNWIVWFAIDVVATGEYFASGLTLAGFQYVFFTLNCFYGFWMWYKSMKARSTESVATGSTPAQSAAKALDTEPDPA